VTKSGSRRQPQQIAADPNAGAAAAQGQAVPQVGQAVSQVGQAVPQPIHRARSPATWSRNNELDYGNKQDKDYYKQASEKLEGESYNGKNLSIFLKRLVFKETQQSTRAS